MEINDSHDDSETDVEHHRSEPYLDPRKDPTMWSISYEQLMDVHHDAARKFGQMSYHRKTMRDVNQYIIKPLCQKKGTSFALVKNPQGLKINVFITHAWDEPFQDFIHSIEHVFQTWTTKPNLWICAFALNQDETQSLSVELEMKPIEESPFVRALKKAKHFVVVRNSTTDLYSRIWCVCELYYAHKFGLTLENTYVTGPDNFSDNSTSSIDASSTVVQDKEKILQEVIQDNVEEIDDLIKRFRQQHPPTLHIERHIVWYKVVKILWTLICLDLTILVVTILMFLKSKLFHDEALGGDTPQHSSGSTPPPTSLPTTSSSPTVDLSEFPPFISPTLPTTSPSPTIALSEFPTSPSTTVDLPTFPTSPQTTSPSPTVDLSEFPTPVSQILPTTSLSPTVDLPTFPPSPQTVSPSQTVGLSEFPTQLPTTNPSPNGYLPEFSNTSNEIEFGVSFITISSLVIILMTLVFCLCIVQKCCKTKKNNTHAVKIM